MSDIFALSDIKVRRSASGNEYAAVPIRNPKALSTAAPHKWMPSINGHLTGEKYLTERHALRMAETLANDSAHN